MICDLTTSSQYVLLLARSFYRSVRCCCLSLRMEGKQLMHPGVLYGMYHRSQRILLFVDIGFAIQTTSSIYVIHSLRILHLYWIVWSLILLSLHISWLSAPTVFWRFEVEFWILKWNSIMRSIKSYLIFKWQLVCPKQHLKLLTIDYSQVPWSGGQNTCDFITWVKVLVK